jgi:epoxyqueuosine reductase
MEEMKLSRKDFLKSVGLMMGVAATGSLTGAAQAASSSPRTDKNGLTVRKRKYKYPWWVKTVDQITTEINPDIMEKPGLHYIIYGVAMMPDEEVNEWNDQAKTHVKEGIVNNIPGRTLPDLALHYACHAYMTAGSIGSFDSPRIVKTEAHKELLSYNLHPPQDIGLPAWQATPETASKTLEAAGVQLGASMVGFTKFDPQLIYPWVKLDPDATEMTYVDGKGYTVPKKDTYVVVMISQGPRDLLVRNQSELGAAGDRAVYARTFSAGVGMVRFIRGLGYSANSMQALSPVIPYALSAGLGELGRMNRMINPIFGGNIRITCILTDLPLAPDKPIDFGLQEFCRHCKKCATECPSGALSLADDPYWVPVNGFQAPGKRVYFEDNDRCVDWISKRGNFCSTCMSVCPWSKQDVAALHEMTKIMAAKTPKAGTLFTQLDDAFGYGMIEPGSQEVAEWWDLDIPEQGIDSYQGKK